MLYIVQAEIYSDPMCCINHLINLCDSFSFKTVFKSVIWDFVSQTIIWPHNIVERKKDFEVWETWVHVIVK